MDWQIVSIYEDEKGSTLQIVVPRKLDAQTLREICEYVNGDDYMPQIGGGVFVQLMSRDEVEEFRALGDEPLTHNEKLSKDIMDGLNVRDMLVDFPRPMSFHDDDWESTL